jgi:peptide subunit release factor 1 (eRF1)
MLINEDQNKFEYVCRICNANIEPNKTNYKIFYMENALNSLEYPEINTLHIIEDITYPRAIMDCPNKQCTNKVMIYLKGKTTLKKKYICVDCKLEWS